MEQRHSIPTLLRWLLSAVGLGDDLDRVSVQVADPRGTQPAEEVMRWRQRPRSVRHGVLVCLIRVVRPYHEFGSGRA
jgi:hypothetical protein